ncbi:hypothetical protein BJX99DRAFT_261195 [Aspergillus californicus]
MSLSQLTGWILDFRCLERFFDKCLEPKRIRLASSPEVVPFSDLWFLFPVGCLVYVRDHQIPQKVWQVIQRTGGRKYATRPDSIPSGDYKNSFSDFVLDCYHLDYDGSRYKPTFGQFKITRFYGSQTATTLPIMPLAAEEHNRLVVRTELVDRGKQFTEYTRVCHRHYSGRKRIDSEIMVDFERAHQELPSWRPGRGDFEPFEMDYHEKGDFVDPDEVWDKRFTQDFIDRQTKEKWKGWVKGGLGPTEEDDLLLLPDRVFAFVLRTRKWACLQFGKDAPGKEQLTKLRPHPKPWNSLELPEGHKEIVQSLVMSHFANNRSRQASDQDDRKGRNNLAPRSPRRWEIVNCRQEKCVAESYAMPLLPITCGDLGLTPSEVEEKLQQIFRLAQAWNCVTLLDEADIFLSQRPATDIERNALVSVFLRDLEYYEGILFLTTNRVGVFDEAIKSRIHMSLYYPPLKLEQTLKICNTHIARATQSPHIQADAMSLIACANEIFNRQLDTRFGPVWNCRQIRNAFQSAVSLAGFHTADDDLIKLERKYFEHVFKASDHFSNYVWSVNQHLSDAQLNTMKMVRKDDWTAPSAANNDQLSSSLYQQRGQLMPDQARLSAFPQSTIGQTLPRTMTPLGPRPQQIMGNMPDQMLGTQQMLNNQAQAQAQAQEQMRVPESQSQTAHYSGRHVPGLSYTGNEAGATQ